MSILTKIFVVLLVVFSIAFTMTTISFVAQTNNWKQLALDYQQQAQVSDTHQRNLMASHAAEVASLRDAINSLNRTIAEQQTDNERSMQQVADLKIDLAQVRADKTGTEAHSRQLAGELQVAQAGWMEEKSQRESLESRNIELEKRNLDLAERVNEQNAQILVLVQQQRQQEQQINILKQENAKLATARGAAPVTLGGTGLDSVSPLTAPAGSAIRGRVVEVAGQLVTLSIGSADGVRPGMVFVIYRGTEYVGDVRISDVEPNRCAGRLIRARGTPRINDAVADEARFGSAN